MRIPNKMLQELIDNEGELTTGPITSIGILRLALDLKETRETLADIEKMLGGKRNKEDRQRLQKNADAHLK